MADDPANREELEPSTEYNKAVVTAAALLAAKRKDPLQTRALAQIKAAHRRNDRLLDRTVMVPVRRSYDQAIGQTVSALGRMFKGQMRNFATVGTVNTVLNFIMQAMPGFSRRVAEVLATANRDTSVEGVRSVSRFLNLVRQAPSPLDDVPTMARIATQRQAALQALQGRTADSIAKDLTRVISNRVKKATAMEWRVSEIISETGVGLDDEWWRIERTVKTETSSMFNEATMAAILLVSQDDEFSGMMSRWTEMIDDLTGRPLDNRVAPDSMALHGQVARPGGLFTMPSAARVPAAMIGKAWTHPPNRPNDRALLTPWMRDWKVPGWLYRGGTRVPL